MYNYIQINTVINSASICDVYGWFYMCTMEWCIRNVHTDEHRDMVHLHTKPQFYKTRIPCRFRQKAGFAGPWERATLTRRREPANANTPANETAKMAAPAARMKRDRYA